MDRNGACAVRFAEGIDLADRERQFTSIPLEQVRGISYWKDASGKQQFILIHTRWVLFPPGTPKDVIVPLGGKYGSSEGIEWFHEVLPRLPVTLPVLDFVQHAGECVFVPGAWWHVVVNLEFTVAGALFDQSDCRSHTQFLFAREFGVCLAKDTRKPYLIHLIN